MVKVPPLLYGMGLAGVSRVQTSHEASRETLEFERSASKGCEELPQVQPNNKWWVCVYPMLSRC